MNNVEKDADATVILPKPAKLPEAAVVPIAIEADEKKGQLQTNDQKSLSKRATDEAYMLRMRCKQLCISAFFHEHVTVRSLGFTSAIHGEGKSFLARLAAGVMTEDNNMPVTLLECNWENPSFGNAFNLKSTPGLAEWLTGNCKLEMIRQQVSHNLTVITAGNGKDNALTLLQAYRQRGVLDVLSRSDEVLIVDLPSTVTTAYGQFAARLCDALVLVVRMGVTPENFVAEACQLLKDAPVQGVVFNQIKSRVPRWLRQIL